jgi:hypothetical protein
MDAFEPLVNLLILLSVLSVAAERATNLVKLRDPAMSVEKDDKEKEKQREKEIAVVTLVTSVVLAVALKANLFEIMTRLDAPWNTLGWVQMSAGQWVRSPATDGLGTVLYAIGGSLVTGVALGFGSKFWHDMLDIVFNARERLKQAAKAAGGK